MTLEVLSPSVTWAKVVPSGGKLRAGNVLLPTNNNKNNIQLLGSEHFVLLLLAPIFLKVSTQIEANGHSFVFTVCAVIFPAEKKKISCASGEGGGGFVRRDIEREIGRRPKLKEDERKHNKTEKTS